MSKRALLNPISNRFVYAAGDLNTSPEYLKSLLRDGADINAYDEEGNTALHRAISINRSNLFNLLIEKKANVTILNKNNHTALDIAKQKGNVDIIHVLDIATRYASSVQQDRDLLLAARLGYFDKVKDSIKNKADANTCNANGVTPLHMAATSGVLDVVKYLVEQGSNFNIVDIKKITPLHMACLYGHVEVAGYLIEKGANINALDSNELTPLHYATMNEGARFDFTIKLLIQKNADPNLTSKMDFTFLYKISHRGKDEIVNLVLKYIDNINEVYYESKVSALHAAAMNGHIKTVHLLLSAGIDVTIKNIDGHTAAYLAKNNTFYGLWNIINSNETKLISAVANGKISVVRELLKKGTDINYVAYYNYNALDMAVKKGHKDIVKFLLERNVDIITDVLRENPLYSAARNNECTIMKMLIDYGVNPKSTNWLGKTAFDYTTECKHLELYSAPILLEDSFLLPIEY